jgi:hypothetical protein
VRNSSVAMAVIAGSFIFVTTSIPSLSGQDTDSDSRLRTLLKTVPQLPVELVDLTATPPRTFEGISAVTADQHGNIYVIHRPHRATRSLFLIQMDNSFGRGVKACSPLLMASASIRPVTCGRWTPTLRWSTSSRPKERSCWKSVWETSRTRPRSSAAPRTLPLRGPGTSLSLTATATRV